LTCDPNREDLLKMTQQAPSADRPSTAVDAVLQPTANAPKSVEEPALAALEKARPLEIGGRDGPEPTRFGDWEMRGRCIDF
jgi:hypothetical protein